MSVEYRRKAPRRDYDGMAGVLYKGKMKLIPCSQVGEGGALLNYSKEEGLLAEGDFIVITLFFPQIGGVVSTAECVYVSEKRKVGLSFHNLGMDFKKKIRDYVSRRKTLEASK